MTCRSTSSTIPADRCRRLLAAGTVLLSLVTLAQKASAATDPCTWIYNGSQIATPPAQVLSPANINLGTLSSTVPADLLPGSTIGPASTTFTVAATCSSSQYFNLKSLATPATNPSTVWKVPGIPGVGLELKINGVLVSDLSNGAIRNIGASSVAYPATTFSYRLVRTSEQILGNGGSLTDKSQSLPTFNYFQLGANTSASGFPSPARFLGPAIVATFPVSTCSAASSSLAVSLPTVRVSTFTSVGSTAGKTDFNFMLTCTAGSNIYATLTDGANAGNTSNLLTLGSTSSASGVALQILYNNVPENFGVSSSIAGNPGQFSVGTAQTGTFNLPLTARYIRTGTVVPGTVKATATITMSYQ